MCGEKRLRLSRTVISPSADSFTELALCPPRIPSFPSPDWPIRVNGPHMQPSPALIFGARFPGSSLKTSHPNCLKNLLSNHLRSKSAIARRLQLLSLRSPASQVPSNNVPERPPPVQPRRRRRVGLEPHRGKSLLCPPTPNPFDLNAIRARLWAPVTHRRAITGAQCISWRRFGTAGGAG